MRLLELFSGLGGVSAALSRQHQVVVAIDINELASEVYRANFSSPFQVREIMSLTDQHLSDFEADVWWMSPPCQPFTRRGRKGDLNDPRSQALLRIANAIKKVQPNYVAMENVVGFEESDAFDMLARVLSSTGYQFSFTDLCSTQFGLPNLRPRFFLAASRLSNPKIDPILHSRDLRPISQFLDSAQQLANWGDSLRVNETILNKYYHAVSLVEPDSTSSRCFTSAYGKSVVRSGSYLKTSDGFRRFSPSEQLRLLGFSNEFQLPSHFSTRQLWKLVGNSVSIPCVQHVLNSLGT